ncbi:hypothetical protein VTH82DRAFT_1132 [Thermothelomyces myriococcoides]
MAKRPELRKAPFFALATRQVKKLEKGLKDITKLEAIIKAGQKKANRLFVPTVAEWMASAYTYCVDEHGQAALHFCGAEPLRKSSLLANQNIFKTLEAARDKIWDLLNEVDERFGLVLHPTVRSGIPNRSNGLTTVDVDIEGSVPVVGPETTLKNPVVATGARDAHSSATNIKDNVRVKRESPFTTALEEDIIAEDADGHSA